MDKIQLIETAMQLKSVSNESYTEYQQKAEALIAKMNEVMLNRHDLEFLVGKDNVCMMKDNHANHVRFITSIIKNYNPEVFVDTILWVFRAYRSHGFSTTYWAAQLNAFIGILKEHLSMKSYNEIYPYYEWMQVNIPTFVLLSDKKLDVSNSLH